MDRWIFLQFDVQTVLAKISRHHRDNVTQVNLKKSSGLCNTGDVAVLGLH